MKKIYAFLIVSLLGMSFMYAQGEEPVLTITTRLTEGTGYSFTIYYYSDEFLPGEQAGILYVDFGSGQEEFPVINGSWVENTIGGLVGSEGIVRIYGDAKFIQGFDSSEDPNYPITAIDISRCRYLEYLYLENNKLTDLDLRNHPNLIALSLYDNIFTAVPDLSNNPKLKVLNLRYNYSIPNLEIDFSQFPDLEEINIAQNNFSSVDVSQNPKLKELSIANIVEYAKLETLDVTNNPELETLWVDTYKLAELDLSKNPKLETLEASVRAEYGQLTSLDVSNNKSLKNVYLSGNKLTEFMAGEHPDLTILSMSYNRLSRIDISNSLYLYDINLKDNSLSEISIPGTSNLATLDLSGNNFRFSTLPRLTSLGTNYGYDRQGAFELTQEMIVENGSAIDLSQEWLVEGMQSQFVWFQGHPQYGSLQLSEGEDYVVREGITYFMKVPADEIYCQMTNEYFPGLTITTGTTRAITTASGIEGKTLNEVTVTGGKGELQVNVPYLAEASVYNLAGSLLMKRVVKADAGNIAVSTPGVYIVKLNMEGNLSSHKVVVR